MSGEIPVISPPGELDAAIHQEIRGTHRVLEMMLDLIRPTHLAATSGGRRIRTIPDWPITGGRRYIFGTSGHGALVTLPAATITDLLGDQPSRVGGQLVNYGANPAFVYLCTSQDYNAGVPAPVIWLSGNGGAWDLMLSETLWAGPVCAISTIGSNVTIAAI